MRRKDDTLRDTLLDYARTLARSEGVDAINIRALAQLAGVATGTVYNYFSGKEEILLALTEEYWRQTLQEMDAAISTTSFCTQLEEIIAFLRTHIDHSAGTLMASLGGVAPAGQARMASMQTLLVQTLVRGLERDPAIAPEVWDATLTREALARFLMANIMLLLRIRTQDPGLLLCMVRRILYLEIKE